MYALIEKSDICGNSGSGGKCQNTVGQWDCYMFKSTISPE